MSEEFTSADMQALEMWKRASEANAQAWTHIERLNQNISLINARVGLIALRQAKQSRRQFLKQLGLVTAVGVASIYSYRNQGLSGLLADYATGSAVSKFELADGSVLNVNADTLVDVQYSNQSRRIKLLRGEVMIRTAHDPMHRELSVETEHGLITALGTRFNVKLFNDKTEVTLFEGKLKVLPSQQNNHIFLEAGDKLIFDRETKANARASFTEDAWVNNMLVVYEMPLAEFLQRLAPYKKGWLSCSQQVKQLRISGSFFLNDIDASLATLEKSLPVKVKHYTRFYTKIEAV